MTKHIIYARLDGGISVVIPSPNSKLTVAQIMAKDVPNDFEVFDVPTGIFETDPDTGEKVEVFSGRMHKHGATIIDKTALPKDRMFRNAWRKSGAKVVTDMPVAKKLAHDMRRAARDAEMKPLDLKATIPTEATKAEAGRVSVRAKFVKIQTDINIASNENALIAVLNKMGR